MRSAECVPRRPHLSPQKELSKTCHITDGQQSHLLQLDKEYFSTATVCKLSAWETSLRRDLATRLTRGTRTAYDRMMSAVDTSDPTMLAIIENLLLIGEPCKLLQLQRAVQVSRDAKGGLCMHHAT